MTGGTPYDLGNLHVNPRNDMDMEWKAAPDLAQ